MQNVSRLISLIATALIFAGCASRQMGPPEPPVQIRTLGVLPVIYDADLGKNNESAWVSSTGNTLTPLSAPPVAGLTVPFVPAYPIVISTHRPGSRMFRHSAGATAAGSLLGVAMVLAIEGVRDSNLKLQWRLDESVFESGVRPIEWLNERLLPRLHEKGIKLEAFEDDGDSRIARSRNEFARYQGKVDAVLDIQVTTARYHATLFSPRAMPSVGVVATLWKPNGDEVIESFSYWADARPSKGYLRHFTIDESGLFADEIALKAKLPQVRSTIETVFAKILDRLAIDVDRRVKDLERED